MYILIQQYMLLEMKNYYDNPAISQSKLKLLLGNPKNFIEVEEPEMFFEEKQHFIIGDAVDCLLTRGSQEFDRQFYISNLEFKPSDVIKSIINEVYSKKTDSLDIKDYTYEILKACDNHNYQANWKAETRINKILENWQYWEELCKSENKTILTVEDEKLILNIVHSFKTSPGTSKYFTDLPDDFTVSTQLPIYFKWEDVDCKSLLDMVIFNHKDKEVYIFDIKTTGDEVSNFTKNAERFGYQIQCAFYWKAMEEYLIQNNMFDYEIKSFSFLVESTKNPYNAVEFVATESFRAKGLYGEKDAFKNKKGILELFDDYKYYIENGFEIDRSIRENRYKLTI